ncbi:hypothetical protein, partial [Desulfoluna sp.]|uniref:hypothetical protein n=1 Tax=Desulfoluna sp. TaxID=2045199 RepID=UPI0026293B5B
FFYLFNFYDLNPREHVKKNPETSCSQSVGVFMIHQGLNILAIGPMGKGLGVREYFLLVRLLELTELLDRLFCPFN